MRKLPSSGMKYPNEKAELKKGRYSCFALLLSLIFLLLPLFGMAQDASPDVLTQIRDSVSLPSGEVYWDL